jgi:hypothetical protein
VRVTHPFHPLSGRQFVCVAKRYNRYGTRLVLRVDDETVCSVPPQWTDAVGPDPEIALGERRAIARVADLLVLAELVERLVRLQGRPPARKGKDVASVKQTSPLGPMSNEKYAANKRCKDATAGGRKGDRGCNGGVIVVTKRRSEVGCQNEAIAKTRKQRPSSRTAR